MPLATNPKARFEIVLQSDQSIEASNQPAFVFHYLSGLELEEVLDLLRNLDRAKKGEQALDKVYEIVEKHLIDWRNITNREGSPIDFNRGALKTVVGLDEIFELAFSMINKQSLTVEDKKKSTLPLASFGAKSAKNVRGKKNARINHHD